jgi:sigma-E factor negative regulatory protein RseC
MEETGVVIGKTDRKAQVRIERSEACEGCHACSTIAKEGRYLVTEVDDAVGSETGDIVRIRTEGAGPVQAGALLFLFPLAMLFAGFFAGSSLAPAVGLTASAQTVGIVLGAAFFFAAFGILSLFTKKSKATREAKPTIVEILGRENL